MEKQNGAAGAADGAWPNRKHWSSSTSGTSAGETLDSPTGSHVEWCKQLIAATISSQISGSVPSDIMNRDNKQDLDDERLCFHEESNSEHPSNASASLLVSVLPPPLCCHSVLLCMSHPTPL
nr:PREDICTED: myotubularin-related protein 1-like isoform X1 [Paralichthys olivaceus]XP_019965193.1 PREDICTED: myotubularin-related protein 1-like isoform X1 [Paralichthys olivaceus]